ncbi:GNAT family protein [Haloplasma contractile]|nr:hypothetical protein [Haloplasma contractile]
MNIKYALEMKEWYYKDYFFKDRLYLDPYIDQYVSSTNTSKGPMMCEGYAVFLRDKLVGLFEYYNPAGIMTIGLALKPSYIGKGLSVKFIQQGIKDGVK